MNENKIKKKTIIRLTVSILALLGLIGLFYLIIYLLGWTDLTREEIQSFLSSTGAIAPLVFIGISFLQVTFIPIPSNITIIAGNYMFGVWRSFLYSYVGIVFGSLFAFFLGRILGRKFVDLAFGGKEESEKYIEKLKGKESVVLFFMFLLPAFPDDALCALAGILPISWTKFIFIQLTTRITSILGTLFFMSGEIIPYNALGIAIIILVAILSVIAFIISLKNAEKINKAFDEFTNKIAGKIRKNKKNNEP